MGEKLNFANHNRHFKDCEYVYPVVSRRSEGVSLGVNLNLNKACNWRCIYCQVDGLQRGKPDNVDLVKIEHELDLMLDWIVNGDFIANNAPEELQRFNDICLAGNGEPTLSPQFTEVCNIITKLRQKYSLGSMVKTILITNGSELKKLSVQAGIKILAQNNGEVWFKIDRASSRDIQQVNQVNVNLEGVVERLQLLCSICPTYIQSCWFCIDYQDPEITKINEFIRFLALNKFPVKGVLLYSTARAPALVEGGNITSVSIDFLANFAKHIENIGYNVKCYQ